MGTAIVQARMGSSRLPGKTLEIINGKPLIQYTLDTLKYSPVIRKIVVAITDNRYDDILAEYLKTNNYLFFRGDENDVLKRFLDVSNRYPDEYYFRVTADNPIMDRDNAETTLNFLLDNALDYAAVTGMPVGSIVECVTGDALRRCARMATSPSDKEHVTLFIKQSGQFNIGYKPALPQHRYPDLRLTVDYPEDLERARIVIGQLYKTGVPDFTDIVQFCLDNRL